MDNIGIKRATIDDIGQLQKISIHTFSETFSAANSPENMKQYLEESFSVEKLVSELGDGMAAFYLASLNNKVIGYLKLNFGRAQTELKDNNAIEIERVYVLKEFHGKGVGQLLYEKAIQVAKQAKAAYVWLGVWEENPRAIKFYEKNGFVEFDRHIFRLGNEAQTDIMMKLKLS